MRGPAARFVGIALAAAGIAAAASAFAAPASSGYDEGLAAYQKNDYAKSLKVLHPLAEKGDARAQYLVGRQYQFGQAVKADRAQAFYWYKRAEAKGHLEAKLFRLLLEKRWKITAAEKVRAERKIAAENAPKPPARAARIESKPKPRPERAVAAAEKPGEKTRQAARVPERARPAKRRIEVARTRPPEPPKAETAKAKPERVRAQDKPAIVAARTTIPDETTSTEPPVRRGTSELARATPRPTMRSDDDDDGASPRRHDTPPPESRTTIAAVPNAPPPGDDHASDHPPYQSPRAPDHAPPGPYFTPGMVPYYSHGPAPYYAPAAPPSWRASIHLGPRPYYRQPWGYRPHAAYVHPGWRGRGWRGRGWRGSRGRW